MKLLIFCSLFFGVSALADPVSFDSEVRPIFNKACSSCHNAKSKLPNLLDYNVAFKLKDSIRKRVSQERSMPYVGRITESERNLIELWSLIGAE